MSALWTGAEIVAAIDGRPVGNMPDSIGGISIDSRTITRGDAFFAIRGERFDGHDFASAATANGAGLLVVSEAKLPALGRLKVPMIVVDDVLVALEKLGAAARRRTKAQVIAVTGSAGKTTTKEALRVALSPSGKVHASAHSFNNHWGVPLTLASLPQDADFGIFEIGMNHADEIRPLVKLVAPHIGIITLVAQAHLGHFGSLSEIAEAKAELFEGIVEDGHALINRDDRQWTRLRTRAREAGVTNIHGFGEHRQARYKLLEFRPEATRSEILVRIDGADHIVQVGAPGRHMAQNILAVLAAVHLAGADLGRSIVALAGFQAEKGRGQRLLLGHEANPITLVDESYNANPASMRAALELLSLAKPGEGGRRIAVLGDMLELGDHSEKLHADLANEVRKAEADLVFLGGPEMAALARKLESQTEVHYAADTDELGAAVLAMIGAGDVIMVKSSKGIGFSRIVDLLVKRYPPGRTSGN